MARPRVEIQRKRGENLKQLCRDEGISQAALANMIHISQQTISKICTGKATLTEQTAKLIVEKYPQYRLEWLLGYDCFKTVDERISALLGGQEEIQEIIEKLMALHGYRIVEERAAPNTARMTNEELLEYMQNPYYEIKRAIKDWRGNTRYLDMAELTEMFRSIDDFIEFVCSRKVQKPFTDYLHTRKEVD